MTAQGERRAAHGSPGFREVRRRCLTGASLAGAVLLLGCGAGGGADTQAEASRRAVVSRPATALTDSAFGALHARISEPGGFFDTDNLISNETGYLNVLGALDRLGLGGGAYVGVGPDQNYSYIAQIRPDIAFIIDVRRDNALHHLLLKALIERAPTRLEFLAGLHGRTVPADVPAWAERDISAIVAWVAASPVDRHALDQLQDELIASVAGYGIPLEPADEATIRRFHATFVDAGPGLRFTTFGRPPRPYYPTFGELILETDAEGRQASYLSTPEAYRAVRDLHLANRIVPVVGDLAGAGAMREMGLVMGGMGLELSAFYASNVEFYLWRAGAFDRWVGNLASLPAGPDAVVIRSYFPNFGGQHPSALPGYHATQSLQRVETLIRPDRPFGSYWDVVTRNVVPLREVGAGR